MYNKPMKSINGFTIVELLIVIVVIGILASVTVVAFNGASNKAVDATILADLRDASIKMNRLRIDTGQWPQNWGESVPPGQFGGTASPEHGIRVTKRSYYAGLHLCGYGRPSNSPSYFGPTNSTGLMIVGRSQTTSKVYAVLTESNTATDISSYHNHSVSTDTCASAGTAFDVKPGFQWNLQPYVGSNS